MIYTIKNNVLEVKINSLGAEICSIKKDNIEMLYQKDSTWKKQSPMLFPMIGSSKDNKYIYNDIEYVMGQHGFAHRCEFTLVKHEYNLIKLILKDNDELFKIYPFKFNLIITYEIVNNKLEVKWEVINKGENIMYFNIGGHPAFILDNNSSLIFDDEIDYKVYGLDGPFITNLIAYNSTIKSINPTELVLKHDTAIFKGLSSVTLSSSNKSIRIDSNTSFLAFWHDSESVFLCIEPWEGLPDYIDATNIENKKHIIKLNTNSNYESGYTITIK